VQLSFLIWSTRIFVKPGTPVVVANAQGSCERMPSFIESSFSTRAEWLAAGGETLAPRVTKPRKVVDTANITISEYFGRVATRDGTASFALVNVRAAEDAAYQTPSFAEYVICNEGAIELVHSDGLRERVEAGEGAYLPANLRVKWSFPGPCSSAVVLVPALSPELAASEEGGAIVDAEAAESLRKLHGGGGSAAPAAEADETTMTPSAPQTASVFTVLSKLFSTIGACGPIGNGVARGALEDEAVPVSRASNVRPIAVVEGAHS
jgi:hypothetical protein